MRAPLGGGGGGRGGHTCNNCHGVIVTPYVVAFSPSILPETLHFLCNNGFRVGMLEVLFFCFNLLCGVYTLSKKCMRDGFWLCVAFLPQAPCQTCDITCFRSFSFRLAKPATSTELSCPRGYIQRSRCYKLKSILCLMIMLMQQPREQMLTPFLNLCSLGLYVTTTFRSCGLTLLLPDTLTSTLLPQSRQHRLQTRHLVMFLRLSSSQC